MLWWSIVGQRCRRHVIRRVFGHMENPFVARVMNIDEPNRR
jgi:hypothetical protein